MKFLAKVISGYRITIPELIREKLDIQEGDVVMVDLSVEIIKERKKQ